jgi:hypothetical protein
MADFDMNRTLTLTDISRRLGARRRECRRDNGQFSQTYINKIFGSTKFVS